MSLCLSHDFEVRFESDITSPIEFKLIEDSSDLYKSKLMSQT